MKRTQIKAGGATLETMPWLSCLNIHPAVSDLAQRDEVLARVNVRREIRRQIGCDGSDQTSRRQTKRRGA